MFCERYVAAHPALGEAFRVAWRVIGEEARDRCSGFRRLGAQVMIRMIPLASSTTLMMGDTRAPRAGCTSMFASRLAKSWTPARGSGATRNPIPNTISSKPANKKIFIAPLRYSSTLLSLARHTRAAGPDSHRCKCSIVDNNWLARRCLATKASTRFNVRSGTPRSSVSRMMGECGRSRLSSIATS